MLARSILPLVFGVLLSGCTVDALFGSRNDNTEIITGTITYIDLEGGFWAVVSTDGETYDPVNLPEDFKHEGLRVRIRAKIRGDLAGIHMVGLLIEILHIERLE